MTVRIRARAQAFGGRLSRRRRIRSGQSLVEFALVVPLMMLFFLAIADFARLYTTMMTVESAAREAADYGAFSSSYWTPPNGPTSTRAEMTHRACLASSNLPDYQGVAGPPATCSNPEVISIDLIPQPGGTECFDPQNPRPCWVKVTLEYDFRLLAPFSIEFFNVHLGLPTQLTFQRTSTFAMTDLQLETPPPPTPPNTPFPEPTWSTPDPTPEPTPEPTPDPGPTPEPTPDPGPTPPPTPGPTPPPDPTPTPEPDPTPTPEPDPTPTPTPDPTPDPTPTPEAS